MTEWPGKKIEKVDDQDPTTKSQWPGKKVERAQDLPPSEPGFFEEYVRGAAAPITEAAKLVKETTGIGASTKQTEGEGVKKADKAKHEQDAGLTPGYVLGSMTTPMGLSGMVAKALPKAIGPVMRSVAGGALGGLVSPTSPESRGQQFWEEKKTQVALGPVFGFGISMGGKAVSKGIEALGRWIAKKNPEWLKNEAVATILRRIQQDNKSGSPTAKDMLDLMAAGGAQGKPMSIIDFAGPNLESLGGRVMRQPGPGQAFGKNFLEMRDRGAPDRLTEDVGKYVFSGDTMHQTTSALMHAREAAARPLYEEVDQLQGIWSPRLDEFFKNRHVQKGMALGYDIERNRALAEGRRFDATQLGVDLDAEGNIKFLRKPNMYVLDMAKKGLDAMIAKERNEITGRMSAFGASLEAVRKSYVGVLDGLDSKGIYKRARDAWAGPSESLDALKRGYGVFDHSPEENTEFVAGLSENNKQFALTGVADRMLEKLQKAGLSSDESKSLINNVWTKRQMQPFFKTEQDFEGFVNSVANERIMHTRMGRLVGGSPTQPRATEDVSDINLGARALSFAKIGKAALEGRLLRATGEVWRIYRDNTSRSDPKLNEEIAKVIFSPDILDTDIGRRLAAGDPYFANPLQNASAAVQNVVAPALATGTAASARTRN